MVSMNVSRVRHSDSMNKRVLVVDDEAAIRRAVRRILERRDYEVFLASGGDEACQVLDSHTIDVILLDLHMPGMSGATLFHVIATQWPVMASRVIVMSGDDDARARESWLALNRLPMVPKPFQIKELLEAVERMLPRPAREANGH